MVSVGYADQKENIMGYMKSLAIDKMNKEREENARKYITIDMVCTCGHAIFYTYEGHEQWYWCSVCHKEYETK